MESSSVKSMTGVTTGTPAYMAPEQVTGTDVGPAADRYSLATIAYELLTGGYPFDGEGVLEMLYAHVHREPPLPSSRNPALGPAVDSVILRGLAKDPGERWPTCEEFVAALQTALNAGPASSAAEKTISLARPAPALAALAPAIAAPLQIGQPVNGARTVPVAPAGDGKPSRRSPYLVGAILMIPLLLVAGYCGFNTVRQSTLARSPQTARTGDRTGPVATPSAAPTESPSANPTQPPGVVPNGGPTPRPQPSTAPNPAPSPSPAPSPPPAAPSISLSSTHIAMLTGSVTVNGLRFGAGKVVTISFIQGATNQQTKTTASSEGSFSRVITVPATAVVGQATIIACDSNNACASQPIMVTTT
jgi:serine/threonine-protein kinase